MPYLLTGGRRTLGECRCDRGGRMGAILSNSIAQRIASPRIVGYEPITSTAPVYNPRYRRAFQYSQNPSPISSAPVVNPATGAPSTVENYDAEGNPTYSVPPPGQAVIGYDVSGNPLYGAPPQGTVIVGYQSGLPVYGLPSQSQTGMLSQGLISSGIVGYDSYGNPIYAGSAAAAALAAQSAAAATPAAAGASTAPSTTATDYSAVLDWFSQSTLLSGVPNWMLVAGIGVGVVVIQSRRGRR